MFERFEFDIWHVFDKGYYYILPTAEFYMRFNQIGLRCMWWKWGFQITYTRKNYYHGGA